ncbi:unnamed protein product, partial [Dicrocoelium dendriticum]
SLMSVNYATALSDYANKGVCGMPELFDDATALEKKLNELYLLMRQSRYTVVHTGAGISTSVGIPDFRGPRGIWTLEKLGKNPPTSVPFESATPSLAHQILVEFECRGLIHYLVTQNIDGLHLRSGFPRDRLSILHGDMFLEVCDTCGTLFPRNTPSVTVGLRRTDTSCTYIKPSKLRCRGKLTDTILDWESDLPTTDYNLAIEHSKRAELHICIGTSLQMYPAASLPLLPGRPKRSSSNVHHKDDESPPTSKMVIVNLQRAKLFKRAHLNIHAPADFVLGALADKFNIPIPCKPDVSSSSFIPSLLLRSIHSSPDSRLPWRILPHPTNGAGVRILDHALVTATKEAPSCDFMKPVNGDDSSHTECDTSDCKRIKLCGDTSSN